jgi:hypothetical protein
VVSREQLPDAIEKLLSDSLLAARVSQTLPQKPATSSRS